MIMPTSYLFPQGLDNLNASTFAISVHSKENNQIQNNSNYSLAFISFGIFIFDSKLHGNTEQNQEKSGYC